MTRISRLLQGAGYSRFGSFGGAMATVEEMITDIQDADGTLNFQLNTWEKEFIDSIEDWLSENDDLTDNQLEKLEEIWNKI